MARFTRQHRLLCPAQFQRVFQDATRAGDPLVTVLARTNNLPFARLGLAVGRRKIAHAHRRNLFKRLVRESFRARQGAIEGLDLIVMPKPAAATADRQHLRASIDRQWPILQRRFRVN